MKKTLLLSASLLSAMMLGEAGAEPRNHRSLDEAHLDSKDRLEKLEKMTPDQWREVEAKRRKNREEWSKLTPEEKEEILRQRELLHKKLERMTPEERENYVKEKRKLREPTHKNKETELLENERYKGVLLEKRRKKAADNPQ